MAKTSRMSAPSWALVSRGFIGVLIAASLASCGGGGSDGGTTPPAPGPTTPAPGGGTTPPPSEPPIVGGTAKVFALPATATPALRAAVTEMLSPVGSAPPGAAVTIPDPASAPRAPVLAVDANGRILAAALASGSGELTADSTAAALVLWLVGPDAARASPDQIEAQARAMPSFAALVQSVASAQAQAEPVTGNPQVQHQALAVVQELAGALRAAATPASRGKARPQAVAASQVAYSGHAVVQGSFGGVPMSVTVRDADFRSAILVRNTTPLTWAVRTERQDGSPLEVLSPGTPVVQGYGVVEGASLRVSLLEAVPLVEVWGIAPEVELQDLPREGFNLRVRQTQESWNQNWRAVIQESAKLLLKYALPSNLSQEEECYANIASFTVQVMADELAALEPNVTNLKAMLGRALENRNQLLDACVPDQSAQLKQAFRHFVTVVAPEVMGLYEGVSRVSEVAGDVYDGVSLLARLHQMWRYRGYDETFGICESLSLFGNGTIVNCLTRLEIVPFTEPGTGAINESPSFLVGSRLDMQLRGFHDGANTPLPASLRLVNSFPNVMSADLSTWRLEALQPGTVGFDVRDTATGVSDALVGRVVQTAQLSAQKTNLLVGETTGLRLTDNFGRYVFAVGSPIEWSASAPEAVGFNGSLDDTHAQVTALRPTSEAVVITARVGGVTVGTVTLDPIQSAPLAWLGRMTQTGCTQAPDNGTWLWEVPCYNTGPYFGAYESRFYFDEASGVVILQSQIQGLASVRKRFELGWRAGDPVLRLNLPSRSIISFAGDTAYRQYETVRAFEWTVERRSPGYLAGRYTVRAMSGYNSPVTGFQLIPTVTYGTWEAFGGAIMPDLQMNGFDLCIYGSQGASGLYYNDLSLVPFTAPNHANSLTWGPGGGSCVPG
jgi:hypothetical protein